MTKEEIKPSEPSEVPVEETERKIEESEGILGGASEQRTAFEPKEVLERLGGSSVAKFLLGPEEQSIVKRMAQKSEFKNAVNGRLEGKEGFERELELTRIKTELQDAHRLASEALSSLYAKAPQGELSYRTMSRSSLAARTHESLKLAQSRAEDLLKSL